MKATSRKNITNSNSYSEKSFFNKNGGETFFFKPQEDEKPFFVPATVQPKLTIGKPNDKYEQEADTMADKVMSMESSINNDMTNNANSQLQPKLNIQKQDKPEEEDSLQTKLNIQMQEEMEEEDSLQTKPLITKASMNEPTVSPNLTSKLNQNKGRGRPLPDTTNSFMDKAFGANFSTVNIHTGSDAVQMNQELGAEAFTHGSDIYFNKGAYRPNSPEGKHLLAHELTHVIQQGGNSNKNKFQQFRGIGKIQQYERQSRSPVRRTNSPNKKAPRKSKSPFSGKEQTKINSAHKEALEMVDQALKDLDTSKPISPRVQKVLKWQFRTTSIKDIKHIRSVFRKIRSRLSQGPKIFSADKRGICETLGLPTGVVAYTWQTQRFPIILCPMFFWFGKESQAATLIHEAAHNVGIPAPSFGKDVYAYTTHYRTLSKKEAMETADAYAHFAKDNRQGISVEIGIENPFKIGASFIDKKVGLMLSWGMNFELRYPSLSIVNPLLGIEFIYIPDIDFSTHRVIANTTIGTRLARRGDIFYVDLRTGVYGGVEIPTKRRMAGILGQVSGHLNLNGFDISAFFQFNRSLLEQTKDIIVVGVGGSF